MAVFAPPTKRAAGTSRAAAPVQKRTRVGWWGTGQAAVEEVQPAGSAASLPSQLQHAAEALSGFSLADVRVHHNSREPAQVGALAFARGSEIHLGPGQERHLPHEAWHVVQQKQGRVRATTQVDGAAISDDAGLEAEADRMGRSAADAVLMPVVDNLDHGASGAGVIQRKIMHGGKELDECPDKNCYSEVVESYRADEKNVYTMRDDCSKLATTIHLLKARIYLFPEVHRRVADEAWRDKVKEWKSVEKLFEGDWSIPVYKDNEQQGLFKAISKTPDLRAIDPEEINQPVDGVLPKDFRGNTPFEDLHARLLATSLLVHDRLNLICSKTWKLRKRRLGKLLEEEVLDYLDEISRHMDLLKDYKSGSVAGKVVAFPTLEDKYNLFYNKLETYYRAKLGVLQTALIKLVVHIGCQDPEGEEIKADPQKSIGDYLAEVRKVRGFLPTLVTDLTALLDIQDDPSRNDDEADQIGQLLVPSRRSHQEAVLDATSPARERGMIANIEAAPRPILVKVGISHEDALKKANFGNELIIIYPDDSLEERTLVDKPKE